MMLWNPNLLVPFGYGTEFRTLGWLNTFLLRTHHPGYVRRFIPWLNSKGGEIGYGNGFRERQPVKPGAAPEGESFHQKQKYADGFAGAGAVDVVRRNPKGGNHLTVLTSQVPVQGSAEAKKWGIHMNVGTPGTKGWEPWHNQFIEADGMSSWRAAGCPAPRMNYPLPGEVVVPKPPSTLITDAPPSTPFPLSQNGLQDPIRTRWLQQIMNERWDAGLTVDGDFGPATDLAVRDMQRELRIGVDGVYGSQSANALALFLNRFKTGG